MASEQTGNKKFMTEDEYWALPEMGVDDQPGLYRYPEATLRELSDGSKTGVVWERRRIPHGESFLEDWKLRKVIIHDRPHRILGEQGTDISVPPARTRRVANPRRIRRQKDVVQSPQSDDARRVQRAAEDGREH